MEKLYYVKPETQVFEVETQGVICGSQRGTTEAYSVNGTTYGDGDFE